MTMLKKQTSSHTRVSALTIGRNFNPTVVY